MEKTSYMRPQCSTTSCFTTSFRSLSSFCLHTFLFFLFLFLHFLFSSSVFTQSQSGKMHLNSSQKFIQSFLFTHCNPWEFYFEKPGHHLGLIFWKIGMTLCVPLVVCVQCVCVYNICPLTLFWRKDISKNRSLTQDFCSWKSADVVSDRRKRNTTFWIITIQ